MANMTPILILDDDADIRHTLRLLLEDEGYNVVAFGWGAEALIYLRQHRTPHVIITDYLMPGMMGDEFLRLAQKEFAEVSHCYLLIAAYPLSQMPTEVTAALTAWKIPYIQKPFEAATIFSAINGCQP
jgi:CheY-like chemotaxis protein